MPHVQRTFPLRHPFVRYGCPALLAVGVAFRDPITLLAMVALCVCLVALAWPADEQRPMTKDDRAYWSGYPYDPDPFQTDLDPPHVPVTQVVDPLFLRDGYVVYEVATGEVVEESSLKEGDRYLKPGARDFRERRQIGGGR